MPLIAFRCSDELDAQIRDADGSVSEVIRRALDRYFDNEGPGSAQPALGDEPAPLDKPDLLTLRGKHMAALRANPGPFRTEEQKKAEALRRARADLERLGE